MYIQLQNRQGPEHNWMSKKNPSSPSCTVCKDQHCCMADALPTVLTSVSAGPFGPNDSLSEAQKSCKGWVWLFSYAVAEGTHRREPPWAPRPSSLVWSSPSQTRASLPLGRLAASILHSPQRRVLGTPTVIWSRNTQISVCEWVLCCFFFFFSKPVMEVL